MRCGVDDSSVSSYVLYSFIALLRNAFGGVIIASFSEVLSFWLASGSLPSMSCGVSSIPGCWLNGSIRPVLKHGPRSLTYARVCGR